MMIATLLALAPRSTRPAIPALTTIVARFYIPCRVPRGSAVRSLSSSGGFASSFSPPASAFPAANGDSRGLGGFGNTSEPYGSYGSSGVGACGAGLGGFGTSSAPLGGFGNYCSSSGSSGVVFIRGEQPLASKGSSASADASASTKADPTLTSPSAPSLPSSSNVFAKNVSSDAIVPNVQAQHEKLLQQQADLLMARTIFKADEDNKFMSSQDVTYDELCAMVAAGRTRSAAGCAAEILVVDVRSEDETKLSGMIPTAFSIPINELDDALQLPAMQFNLMYQTQKPPRESSKIIFYCKSGKRAQKACEIARKVGFRCVRSYAGSFDEWSARAAQAAADKEAQLLQNSTVQ